MSKEAPVFIEYDSEIEEKKLVNLFEEKTGRTLYPAQDERLMISLIEYKASLLVNMFNEAAKLNLTQFSKGAVLDCIGEMFDTVRLEGEAGFDILKITLNTTFTTDLVINKGLEVLSKDEKYSFYTVEDLIIPAGETEGIVKIKSDKICSAVNAYRAGDINILVKPIAYIASVSNINGVMGGADKETDEAYISRILLAPERFSCAGSKQSYIYHALSANTGIIDASAQSNKEKATIKISDLLGEEIYTEENGIIETPYFTVNLNHKLGQFEFDILDKTYILKMPPDTTVKIYPLTEEDKTPQTILDEVENLLNGDSLNPMTDNVIALSPQKIEKNIRIEVKITEYANLEKVTEKVETVLTEYKDSVRRKLGTELVPSQIVTKLGAIDGVYSVDTDLISVFSADINEYIDLTFELVIRKGK